MSRALVLSLLSALFAGCAAPREPQVARAEPPVVVNVGDEAGAAPGELRPDGAHAKAGDEQVTEEDVEQARKQERDRQVAAKAGLLGLLQGQANDGAVADVFGKSDLGKDPLSAAGGMWGKAIGESSGAGGLGLRGVGEGGGGRGTGTIGLGRVGTIGKGGGGSGAGYGRGVGHMTAGRGRGPRVTTGQPTAAGKLDKAIIRRIIRRHVSQVRYCYERALAKDPDLAGRLTVKFTIDTKGNVSQVKVPQSFRSDVDRCVERVFRRMVFPKPESGVVVVSYPFVFKPAPAPSVPSGKVGGPAKPTPRGTKPTAPPAAPVTR